MERRISQNRCYHKEGMFPKSYPMAMLNRRDPEHTNSVRSSGVSVTNGR